MTPILWIMLSLLFFALGEAMSKYWASKQYWWLLILAIIAYITCEMPWFVAIKEKNHLTSLATIWSVGSVITTVLLGFFWFKEDVTLSQWIGIGLALIACWLLC
jgi:uncharacterized membrane protein